MTNEEVLNFIVKERMINSQYGTIEDDKVYEKVMELLEKQIPKKPTLGGAYKINEWECPNCKSYFAKLNDRPRHCVECGQAIDWGEV